MGEPRALGRARADIADGRLWKARDRLQGLIVGRAANQDVLELLGEVLWQMGDLPAAGRYWYLTEREGEDVRAAVEAMRERYGPDPGVLRSALPIKMPLESYPAIVRERIEDLERAIPRDGRQALRGTLLTSQDRRSWRHSIRTAIVLILTGGIWCVGLIVIDRWVRREPIRRT